MNIALIEPFFTGSHAAWAEGYARRSRHAVEILALGGNWWKWRMHGGAVTLARRFVASAAAPDLLLATDMLDLTTFLALTRRRTARLPVALYFHENQLCYPWSPNDRDVRHRRDHHYGFINFASALAADRVLFNSAYHREAFLDALPGFLKRFPPPRERDTVEAIRERSRVLHLGLDLARFDAPDLRPADADEPDRPPLVLWNHRWEHDKNPEEFFEALFRLDAAGRDFRVAVLGEDFRRTYPVFERARETLGPKMVHYGYVEDFAGYARWLHRADLLPVTSRQDFFGASVAEAVFCGCRPLLPVRLTYPELFDPGAHPELFYRDLDDLVDRLAAAIADIAADRRRTYRPLVERYDWRHMAPLYDDLFASI